MYTPGVQLHDSVFFCHIFKILKLIKINKNVNLNKKLTQIQKVQIYIFWKQILIIHLEKC